MTKTQEIRDRSNILVATIYTDRDGRQEIRDKSNVTLGSYYPAHNQTRDRGNRIVGSGNLLTTLIR